MSYKTILVQVDESRHADARIEIASAIAAAENAHLIGAAMTGVSKFIYETMATSPTDPGITPFIETLRQRAEATLEKFERIAQRSNVMSVEKRLIDDEAVGGISMQARYCDLLVLGQPDREEPAAIAPSDLPESVVMHSGCPALVVPYATPARAVGNKVLIAWNASAESRRAVVCALPFLKRAAVVHAAIFNAESQLQGLDEQPGSSLSHFLGRHGVDVEVKVETTKTDIGNALLSLAATLDSDLMVMGCYGHSRFREVLVGGATRTILESMTLPILMAH
ncbi:universal stress protein [Noviherbaspirillum cavernae]|uniref:Universal stress protein n=1 Tax=Noviherbaspirillum cavernae TaxID=2320862 RepID=A0A418X1V2_9BURK|nr:universal stress protein [Noviherbaspirillum cavernae]RJG06437.1 universal stress protein [Noviherbaspirillum cavernae]